MNTQEVQKRNWIVLVTYREKWVDGTIQSLYLELNLVLEACKIEVALKYAVVYLKPHTLHTSSPGEVISRQIRCIYISKFMVLESLCIAVLEVASFKIPAYLKDGIFLLKTANL